MIRWESQFNLFDFLLNFLGLVQQTSQDIQFNANVNFQYYYKWTNELYASVIGWGAYDVTFFLTFCLIFQIVNVN